MELLPLNVVNGSINETYETVMHFHFKKSFKLVLLPLNINNIA